MTSYLESSKLILFQSAIVNLVLERHSLFAMLCAIFGVEFGLKQDTSIP